MSNVWATARARYVGDEPDDVPEVDHETKLVEDHSGPGLRTEILEPVTELPDDAVNDGAGEHRSVLDEESSSHHVSFDEIIRGDRSWREAINNPETLDYEVKKGTSLYRTLGREPSRKEKAIWRFGKVVSIVLIWTIFFGLGAGGGYLIYKSVVDSQPEQEMPLPEKVYKDKKVSKKPIKLTKDLYTKEWPVYNADSDQGSNTWEVNTNEYLISSMSIKRMAPGSVFIPRVGIYSEIKAEDGFVDSNYTDFQTMKIPKNTRRSGWYSAGAPLTATDTAFLTGERPQPEPKKVSPETEGENRLEEEEVIEPTQEEIDAFQDTQGTTFLAAHVSTTRKYAGTYYNMSADVKAGEVIWAKGFDGSLSTWRVNGMWYAKHTAFPQEYFKATGPRRLVITTCGGTTNQYGYYEQNVFTTAVPISIDDAENILGGKK